MRKKLHTKKLLQFFEKTHFYVKNTTISFQKSIYVKIFKNNISWRFSSLTQQKLKTQPDNKGQSELSNFHKVLKVPYGTTHI